MVKKSWSYIDYVKLYNQLDKGLALWLDNQVSIDFRFFVKYNQELIKPLINTIQTLYDYRDKPDTSQLEKDRINSFMHFKFGGSFVFMQIHFKDIPACADGMFMDIITDFELVDYEE